MAYIYKIVNDVNGKVYIGQTVNIEKRWYKHCYLASSGLDRHLYNAMRKYGIDSFHIEVIEECSEDKLNERERYWIHQYNSTNKNHGYNKSFGGEGGNTWLLNDHKDKTSALLSSKLKGKVHSKESYKAAAEKRRGTHLSDEQKHKISETLKEGYQTGRINIVVPPHYDMTGYHHTNESKLKMSSSRKGKTYDEIYGDNAGLMREAARQRFTGANNPKYKDIPMDEVIDYIKSGYMLKDIAQIYGVRYQTLWSKLKKLGLSTESIRVNNGISGRIRKQYGKRT